MRWEVRIDERDRGRTVGAVLRSRLGLTKRQISRMKFRNQGILVNGKPVRTTACVEAGQVLSVLLEPEECRSAQLVSGSKRPEILYEDEDVIAVSKPAGTVVHPSHGHYLDSLANQMAAYYREIGRQTRVRPVGRLDKDTSGLILFACHEVAAAGLAGQRSCGMLSRVYLALVCGIPSPASGTIEMPIGPMDGELMKQTVRADGRYAKTDYCCIRAGKKISLVMLKLHTGRTHQIRVHMAAIGYPLLGDPLYGNGRSGLPGMERTALHSWRLSFKQPYTGEHIRLEAKLPEDMKNCIMEEWDWKIIENAVEMEMHDDIMEKNRKNVEE